MLSYFDLIERQQTSSILLLQFNICYVTSRTKFVAIFCLSGFLIAVLEYLASLHGVSLY